MIIPSCSLKSSTASDSSSSKIFSRILQKTGRGKNHNILEVNPFALFEISSITGNAVYGWVKPKSVKLVLCMLKLAFPVTEIKGYQIYYIIHLKEFLVNLR